MLDRVARNIYRKNAFVMYPISMIPIIIGLSLWILSNSDEISRILLVFASFNLCSLDFWAKSTHSPLAKQKGQNPYSVDSKAT